MIDVFNTANAAIQIINPDLDVSYLQSTGYTTGAGRKQVPTYASPVTFSGQLQRMTQKEVDKSGVVAVGGEYWKLFIPLESVSSVVRPTSQGGDVFMINGQKWYVYGILGKWAQYTVAMISLQDGAQ